MAENPSTEPSHTLRKQTEAGKRLRTTCPVSISARRVTRLGDDLSIALRRLRRDMDACRRCQSASDCQLLADLRSQVDQAIAEVLEEWEVQP